MKTFLKASLILTALAWTNPSYAAGGVPPSMLQEGRLVVKDWNFTIATPTEGDWIWVTEPNGPSRGQGFVARKTNSFRSFSVIATKYRARSMDQAGAQQFLTDLKHPALQGMDMAWAEVEPGWSYDFTAGGMQGRVFLTDRAAYLVSASSLNAELQPVYDGFVESFQLAEKPSTFSLGAKIGIGAAGLLLVLFLIMRSMSS